MINNYWLVSGVGYVALNNSEGRPAECVLVSEEDIELIDKFTGSWCLDGRGYVKGNSPKIGGKSTSIKMHRYIMEAAKGTMVDHVNHDGLDCRRENLRIATNGENQQNRRGPNINTSSGFRGVCWEARRGKWKAHLKVAGKKRHLGYFDSAEEADKVVSEARANLMPYSTEALSLDDVIGGVDHAIA